MTLPESGSVSEGVQDEIDERAARIVDEEPGAQMSFARATVIRQMLAEQGLDKAREQCDPVTVRA